MWQLFYMYVITMAYFLSLDEEANDSKALPLDYDFHSISVIRGGTYNERNIVVCEADWLR